MQLLHDGGLQTYLFKSVQEDEIICKVRASVERLRDHAELLGWDNGLLQCAVLIYIYFLYIYYICINDSSDDAPSLLSSYILLIL